MKTSSSPVQQLACLSILTILNSPVCVLSKRLCYVTFVTNQKFNEQERFLEEKIYKIRLEQDKVNDKPTVGGLKPYIYLLLC